MCGRYASSRRPEDLIEEFEVVESRVDKVLEPDYAELVAVSVAWSDTTLGYLHRLTCSDPMTGLSTTAHLRGRLAELYRSQVDATGQPMSPEPFAAIRNAVEHYRIDDILISTLAGQQSKWLEEGLIERVKEITEMPIEHYEAGGQGVVERSWAANEELPA